MIGVVAFIIFVERSASAAFRFSTPSASWAAR